MLLSLDLEEVKKEIEISLDIGRQSVNAVIQIYMFATISAWNESVGITIIGRTRNQVLQSCCQI